MSSKRGNYWVRIVLTLDTDKLEVCAHTLVPDHLELSYPPKEKWNLSHRKNMPP